MIRSIAFKGVFGFPAVAGSMLLAGLTGMLLVQSLSHPALTAQAAEPRRSRTPVAEAKQAGSSQSGGSSEPFLIPSCECPVRAPGDRDRTGRGGTTFIDSDFEAQPIGFDRKAFVEKMVTSSARSASSSSSSKNSSVSSSSSSRSVYKDDDVLVYKKDYKLSPEELDQLDAWDRQNAGRPPDGVSFSSSGTFDTFSAGGKGSCADGGFAGTFTDTTGLLGGGRPWYFPMLWAGDCPLNLFMIKYGPGDGMGSEDFGTPLGF